MDTQNGRRISEAGRKPDEDTHFVSFLDCTENQKRERMRLREELRNLLGQYPETLFSGDLLPMANRKGHLIPVTDSLDRPMALLRTCVNVVRILPDRSQLVQRLVRCAFQARRTDTEHPSHVYRSMYVWDLYATYK